MIQGWCIPGKFFRDIMFTEKRSLWNILDSEIQGKKYARDV
jgi:hypothetical protein